MGPSNANGSVMAAASPTRNWLQAASRTGTVSQGENLPWPLAPGSSRLALPAMSDLAIAVAIAGVFGTLIGSFLNVVTWRMPRNQSVVTPPSRCPVCGTGLSWWENLPVIGWLALRGHCRHCDTAIHPRYLLMELAVGALTAGVVLLCLDPVAVPGVLGHGPWQGAPWLMKSGWPGWLVPALSASALLTLVWYLLVASIIDLEHTIIPDELSKGMQLIAPVLAVCTYNCAIGTFPIDWLVRINEIGHATPTPGVFSLWLVGIVGGAALLLWLSEACLRLVYERYMAPNEPWTPDDTRGVVVGVCWFQTVIALWTVLTLIVAWSLPGVAGVILAMQLALAVFGMLAGWWSLYLVGLIGTVAFRRNAMGFGDVKLLAPLGAFLGPFGVLYALAFASVLGSVIGIVLLALRRTVQIPFGPYLALGAIAAMALAPAVHARLLAPLLN